MRFTWLSVKALVTVNENVSKKILKMSENPPKLKMVSRSILSFYTHRRFVRSSSWLFNELRWILLFLIIITDSMNDWPCYSSLRTPQEVCLRTSQCTRKYDFHDFRCLITMPALCLCSLLLSGAVSLQLIKFSWAWVMKRTTGLFMWAGMVAGQPGTFLVWPFTSSDSFDLHRLFVLSRPAVRGYCLIALKIIEEHLQNQQRPTGARCSVRTR